MSALRDRGDHGVDGDDWSGGSGEAAGDAAGQSDDFGISSPRSCPGGAAGIVDHVNELRAELEQADGVTASARLAELDTAVAALDGLRLLPVERVERSGLWREDPNGTAASFLRSQHRRSHQESSADLRAAKALSDFPALRAAVDSGRVSRAHVDVIVSVGQRNESRARLLGDFLPTFLLIAQDYPASTLRTVMRRWADQVDPLQTARDEYEAHQRRYLHVNQVADGVALEGFFGRDQGMKILAAMNAALSDLHHDQRSANASSDGVDGLPVSTAQRRADAFVSLMDRLLASDGLPTARGSRPTVTVLVPLERLAKPCGVPRDVAELLGQTQVSTVDPEHLFAVGCAELGVSNGPGGELMSVEAAQRMSCDCEVHRVVLSPDGLPLDVGRKMRTFPAHMRKALEIRDGGCVFPGCQRPPGWAEAHHIIHWAQGGVTSLENAALLCSRHHHEVHANDHDVRIGNDGRATVVLNRRRL